jgi:hypothetical protein
MEKEFGLIGQESGKNRSKNVNLCFLYLHKLIARQTMKDRKRIGFDSIDIVCAFLFRISVHDGYEVLTYTLEYLPGGSVKTDYYLYIYIYIYSAIVHSSHLCVFIFFLIKPARQYIPN